MVLFRPSVSIVCYNVLLMEPHIACLLVSGPKRLQAIGLKMLRGRWCFADVEFLSELTT